MPLKTVLKQSGRRSNVRSVFFGASIALLLAACGQESSPTPDEDTNADASNGQENVINMTDDMKFTPEPLTIKVGESILWVNQGSLPHTTTNTPTKAAVPDHNILPSGAPPWDSKALMNGETFKQVFNTPGAYTYSCTLHEVNGMIGKIIVE